MNFQFNIKINDQDYLDYNIFWMLRSHYGKKQIKSFRSIITVICVLAVLISLLSGGFSLDSALGCIPVLIIWILIQIFFTKFFVWALKSQIKTLRKSGKMGYSPEAVMEFNEENFIETTPENKTEQKYLAIERISIVENKTVYIHTNNVMAYIIPISCFESKEQYDEFIAFLKTKCKNIDVY